MPPEAQLPFVIVRGDGLSFANAAVGLDVKLLKRGSFFRESQNASACDEPLQ
jgi:hypothetical protein